MNATARCCWRCVGALAAGRRCCCCGWRGSRCSRCARSASRATSTRNSVATIRANAMPQLAGNFFTLDLRRGAARLRVGALGAPGGGAAHLAEPAGGAPGGAPRRRAVGHRRAATTSWSTRFGEVFEANLGDVEDDALPTLQGPDGSAARAAGAAAAPAAGARAAGRAHRDAGAVGPRLAGAPSSTAAPRSSSAAAATTRSSSARERFVAHAAAGDRAAPAAAGARRPAPQRRLCGAARRASRPPCRQRDSTREELDRWPRNTRIWSSAWTSAPPR